VAKSSTQNQHTMALVGSAGMAHTSTCVSTN